MCLCVELTCVCLSRLVCVLAQQKGISAKWVSMCVYVCMCVRELWAQESSDFGGTGGMGGSPRVPLPSLMTRQFM